MVAAGPKAQDHGDPVSVPRPSHLQPAARQSRQPWRVAAGLRVNPGRCPSAPRPARPGVGDRRRRSARPAPTAAARLTSRGQAAVTPRGRRLLPV